MIHPFSTEYNNLEVNTKSRKTHDNHFGYTGSSASFTAEMVATIKITMSHFAADIIEWTQMELPEFPDLRSVCLFYLFLW